MILGSGFSPAFADVVFLTDAVIILIVLIALFLERITASCSAIYQRLSAIAACVIEHIAVRL